MSIRRNVGPGRWALAALLGLAAFAGSARAQYFGQNKVQYESFDWKIIQTEHFDVHFYPVEREAAMDAARMAERSYARLSKILGHRFRERKAIILYASHSDFSQTNTTPGDVGEGTGGFTDFFKQRNIMPLTGSYADIDRLTDAARTAGKVARVVNNAGLGEEFKLPGDLVATGTPEGVGAIQRGDWVEVEISGLGVLRNPVV